MKKVSKKLELNKQVVAKLDLLYGGDRALTSFWNCQSKDTCGCTDGCTSVGGPGGWHTKLNCTQGQCSADCSCATKPFCETMCIECAQR